MVLHITAACCLHCFYGFLHYCYKLVWLILLWTYCRQASIEVPVCSIPALSFWHAKKFNILFSVALRLERV